MTEEEMNGEVDETLQGSGGSDDDLIQNTPPDGIDSLGFDTPPGEPETKVSTNDQQTYNLGSDIGSGDRAIWISPNDQRADAKLDSGNPPKRREVSVNLISVAFPCYLFDCFGFNGYRHFIL